MVLKSHCFYLYCRILEFLLHSPFELQLQNNTLLQKSIISSKSCTELPFFSMALTLLAWQRYQTILHWLTSCSRRTKTETTALFCLPPLTMNLQEMAYILVYNIFMLKLLLVESFHSFSTFFKLYSCFIQRRTFVWNIFWLSCSCSRFETPLIWLFWSQKQSYSIKSTAFYKYRTRSCNPVHCWQSQLLSHIFEHHWRRHSVENCLPPIKFFYER